jgi:hypothetical protein
LKESNKSGLSNNLGKTSNLLISDKAPSEDEVIEEDIANDHDVNTPLINAQTKQVHGKAK